MAEHPTSQWQAMDDSNNVFYRRQQLYTLDRGKLPNLDECIVAGSRYGGPIGVLRAEIVVQVSDY